MNSFLSELQKNIYDYAGKLVEMVDVPFGKWEIQMDLKLSDKYSDLLKAKTQDAVLIIYGYNKVNQKQLIVRFKMNNPKDWGSKVTNNLFNDLGNNKVKKVTVKGKVNPDSFPIMPDVIVTSISWK